MTLYNALMLLLTVVTSNCAPIKKEANSTPETTTNMVHNKHLTKDNLVRDISGHPAFEGFANLLLPNDDNTAYYNTPISKIASLMPYHNAVNPDEVVNAVNHLIDEVNNDRTVFYSFYSEEQRRQDPTKNNTGLFFYRGDLDAPFAIVCPGGGFSYVGSLHEGFPLAAEISSKKLNAFVIRYRIGSEQYATEDLANAIRFIFENAKALQVDTKNYSLWGASAGARMVGNIAYYGMNSFVSDNYPQPLTAVIAYTGQTMYKSDFPATFITVSADDGIASPSTVDRRVQNLKDAGVPVSYQRYKNAGHGFGLGTGTDAKGWLDLAVVFWQKHIKE